LASRSRPEEDSGATFLAADLPTQQGVAELGRRVVEQVGGVDVLVNNAGAASAPAPTLSRSDESWLADLEMNLLSAVRLDRALVPGMVERGSGVVVHVSSIASQLPQRTEASYAATKAALNTYSRELATEVGEHGVRVVCVLPGFVVTDGATAHLKHMAEKQGITTEQVTQQDRGPPEGPHGPPRRSRGRRRVDRLPRLRPREVAHRSAVPRRRRHHPDRLSTTDSTNRTPPCPSP
jgi:NAD(P)-dependent dehydrogenase (short-subunit alcohol dehydrogenase family)